MAASTYYTAVQQLYVAYFGRPADRGGLDYYAGLIENAGGSTVAMMHDFAASTESTGLYNQSMTSAKINAMYQTCFGRDADDSGLAYWTNMVQTGQVLLSEAARVIAYNAAPADKAIYEAKVNAATTFTDSINTTSETQAYERQPTMGRTWLTSVVSTTTAASAQATIDSTLTATITAVNGPSPTVSGGTLAVTGIGTFDITSGAGATDTVTADFLNVTGLTTLTLTAGDNSDIFALRNFVGTATIAANNDTIGAINVEQTGTTHSLKLGGAGSTTITTFVAGASATTLNIESVSNTSTVDTIQGAALTKIVVTGAGTTDINNHAMPSSITEIDGSAATGAVLATLATAGKLKGGNAADTLVGSSGQDVIGGGKGGDAITAGAGADFIDVGGSDASVDTLVQVANDSGAFVTPADNSISTTGFDIVTGMAAGDTIDLAAGDFTISVATTLASLSIVKQQAVFVTGTYDAATGTFVGSATGSDSLFAYDADDSAATVDAEAIVLVGFVGKANDDGVNGVFTLT